MVRLRIRASAAAFYFLLLRESPLLRFLRVVLCFLSPEAPHPLRRRHGFHVCYSENSTCASACQRSFRSAYLPAERGRPRRQLFYPGQGKLRGVAKRARRPKSAFGAGLERLSHVRMAYFERETRELVNLDSCELIRSQFDLVSDYWAGVALDYFAEVTEQLLPGRGAE